MARKCDAYRTVDLACQTRQRSLHVHRMQHHTAVQQHYLRQKKNPQILFTFFVGTRVPPETPTRPSLAPTPSNTRRNELIARVPPPQGFEEPDLTGFATTDSESESAPRPSSRSPLRPPSGPLSPAHRLRNGDGAGSPLRTAVDIPASVPSENSGLEDLAELTELAELTGLADLAGPPVGEAALSRGSSQSGVAASGPVRNIGEELRRASGVSFGSALVDGSDKAEEGRRIESEDYLRGPAAVAAAAAAAPPPAAALEHGGNDPVTFEDVLGQGLAGSDDGLFATFGAGETTAAARLSALVGSSSSMSSLPSSVAAPKPTVGLEAASLISAASGNRVLDPVGGKETRVESVDVAGAGQGDKEKKEGGPDVVGDVDDGVDDDGGGNNDGNGIAGGRTPASASRASSTTSNSDISDWDRSLGSPTPRLDAATLADHQQQQQQQPLASAAGSALTSPRAGSAGTASAVVYRVSSKVLNGSQALESLGEEDIMFCLQPGAAGTAGGASGVAWSASNAAGGAGGRPGVGRKSPSGPVLFTPATLTEEAMTSIGWGALGGGSTLTTAEASASAAGDGAGQAAAGAAAGSAGAAPPAANDLPAAITPRAAALRNNHLMVTIPAASAVATGFDGGARSGSSCGAAAGAPTAASASLQSLAGAYSSDEAGSAAAARAELGVEAGAGAGSGGEGPAVPASVAVAISAVATAGGGGAKGGGSRVRAMVTRSIYGNSGGEVSCSLGRLMGRFFVGVEWVCLLCLRA